jgi:hypothetical protein
MEKRDSEFQILVARATGRERNGRKKRKILGG